MARTTRQTPPAAPHAPGSATPTQSAPTYKAAAAEPIAVDLLDEIGTVVLPALAPDAPFLLAVHPTKWAVENGRVFPMASRHDLRPGVQNVAQTNGRLNWRKLQADLNEKGYTVIPHDWAPNGRTYVDAVAVKGGKAHMTCFESAYAGRNNTTIDQKAYAEWLISLVDRGLIPQPPLVALHDLREKEIASMHNASARATQRPELQQRVELHRANIAAIDTKIAELESLAAPVLADSVDPDEL